MCAPLPRPVRSFYATWCVSRTHADCASSRSLQSQIHYFFEGLGHSPPLEEVHLLVNMSEPWPAQALLDAFKGNRSLKTIHLSGAATSPGTYAYMTSDRS